METPAEELISRSSSTNLAAARVELRLVHLPRDDIRWDAAAIDVTPKPLRLGLDCTGQGPPQQGTQVVVI